MVGNYKEVNGTKYDDPGDFDTEKYEMRVVDTVNFTPSEIEYIDKQSGKRVGYWAYGFFDPESFGVDIEDRTKTSE